MSGLAERASGTGYYRHDPAPQQQLPDRVIQIDPDRLWRIFCACNIHAGAVSDPFHMNYYNFLALIYSCNLSASARRKLTNGQLGVIFRSVAYPSKDELIAGKCIRTRIFEAVMTHKGLDSRREQTHGHKLSYATFIHALTKCAQMVYPNATARQALGRFVYNHILHETATEGAELEAGIRLPFDLSLADAQTYLEDPEVNNFIFEYRHTIDAIFFHLNHVFARGNDASASSPKKDKLISYSEYTDFVHTHLWFERSNPNILSRADLAKIFIAVKHGGGRGVKENLINNQGFKECLVLIALCATRSISVRPPVVHTIAESRSSMSLNQNDLSALSRHESEIHPVDKLKWLFRRIYNSSVACESKVRHLVKFRQQFGRNLMRDGNPFSYLLPYRLDMQQVDEFGTDTASSSGYSGTDSASSSSGATASRRYNRSRAGKSTGRHKSKSNGSQANTVRSGDHYLAKRRVSLAPQSNHLNWITLQDDSGQLYYFNRETNQTQREKPVMGISQPAVPLSPMTLAQRGDPRALARMSALDDMAAAAATSDMNAARTNSEAQMRLEEEAAEVAARWATSLKMRQEGHSGQRSVAEDTGPFLDPYGVGPGPTVGAAPGEESEEEIMRRAMLELDAENRNKSPPWRMDSGVSLSRNGRRGGHHGRTTTMSGFVVGHTGNF